MGAPYYTPSVSAPGAELDAISVNSLIDGLSGFNISPTYTHGQALYQSGILASTTATLTVSSMPLFGTYMLVYCMRTAAAAQGDSLIARFNADATGSHYVSEVIEGGSAAVNAANSNTMLLVSSSIPGSTATTKYFGCGVSFLTGVKGNGPTGLVPVLTGFSASIYTTAVAGNQIQSGAWTQTSAMTSFTLLTQSGSGFAAGTTVSIYGLA